MNRLKIKASTIARIGSLIVVLINQFLALFGKGSLPFTENMVYQVISLVITTIVSAVNCWYNQDVTQVALISGKIFDALNDGKLTENEIEAIVASAENEEELANYSDNAFLIGFANGVIANIQKKSEGEEKKE